MHKLTIDTNLINIKQKLQSMNTLERWQIEGKVKLIGTERLKNETSNNEKASQKVNAMPNVSEPGVWDVSDWEKAHWSNDTSGPSFNELAAVLFPNQKELSLLSKADTNDIMHLMAHADNDCEFFLTHNKKHFIQDGRKNLLKVKFGIVVATPEEAVTQFSEKYGWRL